MKLGSENRNKLIVAVVLMVVAVGLLARWLFSSGDTSSAAVIPPAASVPAVIAPANRITRGKKMVKVERTLDPTLRLDLLNVSEETKYEGKGRDIFRAEAEVIPKAKFPAIVQHLAPPPNPGPQLPPPPPPINLKFYGFASRPGEPKKIFLSQGDDVFIAGEGDIVDRRYKVLQISPTSVEVEDVLTNNRQSIPLTQG
ncbi:MAG TPA: hypothetical protein VGN39_14235 [Terriglobales bacterium]|jgi:hypothetical protein|nr:hypothetical protein [Terriglobales bacterium]